MAKERARRTAMVRIQEGKASIAIPPKVGVAVSSEMAVFYNPVMKSNRDITILILQAARGLYAAKPWTIADPMAATGIRGIRIALELPARDVEEIAMNDFSSAAVKLMKKNLRLNRIAGSKVSISVNEANKFLLSGPSRNYIDVDPFGYPGPFLDSAIRRLQYNGILAVTATDTSALSGSSPNACRRKYLAAPLRNGFMHETAARIMVRLVQLIGSIHGKALIPVFSYSKEHYCRAFFLCKTGAHRIEALLDQHQELRYCAACTNRKAGPAAPACDNCGEPWVVAGPVWVGRLFDERLAKAIAASALENGFIDEKTRSFLEVVAGEAAAESATGVGFFAIEDICETFKVARQPSPRVVRTRLQRAGFVVSPTHCSTTGIKTSAPAKQVIAAVRQG